MEGEQGGSGDSFKIAVVGAGSIGGVTAAILARSGARIEVVCKHESRAEKIRTSGIEVSGRLGEFRVAVPAVARVSELEGTKDLVLLATKAQDMLEPARELMPHLSDRSVVVSLQNGICIEPLAEVVGRNRVVGCVVGWGATLRPDGKIEVTSRGSFVVGRPDGSHDPLLEGIRERLSLIVPTRITENIYGALYSKLMINACINSVGALTGLSLGTMLGRREVPEIFRAILREAGSVAHAAGITLEPYSAQFNFYRLLMAAGPAATALRGLLRLLVIRLGYGAVRSSTLQSLDRGRPTEIDWLNGYIVELGRKHGVATPVNQRIVGLVKAIEEGRLGIGVENLTGILD